MTKNQPILFELFFERGRLSKKSPWTNSIIAQIAQKSTAFSFFLAICRVTCYNEAAEFSADIAASSGF
ncbi:MAG: hypothetical protein SOR38_02610 [Oscillospiraceae bacterium]|nr:hypothetical protein [Oscillospiraceae bacterium]